MNKKFFPPKPDLKPTIYAYELVGVDSHKGLLKVGYSERDSRVRIDEQSRTIGVEYKLVFEASAMRNDGSSFIDRDLHRVMESTGIQRVTRIGREWFKCNLEDVKKAFKSVKDRKAVEENRTSDFKMRPEQKAAVKKTFDYFQSYKEEDPKNRPHFL